MFKLLTIPSLKPQKHQEGKVEGYKRTVIDVNSLTTIEAAPSEYEDDGEVDDIDDLENSGDDEDLKRAISNYDVDYEEDQENKNYFNDEDYFEYYKNKFYRPPEEYESAEFYEQFTSIKIEHDLLKGKLITFDITKDTSYIIDNDIDQIENDIEIYYSIKILKKYIKDIFFIYIKGIFLEWIKFF